MNDKIGIMQGRLTDKGGFYPQQFPWNNWRNEFNEAENAGIQAIEWMFNAERFLENPIYNLNGIKEINKCVERTNVKVSSICANYFMDYSLYDMAQKERNCQILTKIIHHADMLKSAYVVVPLFGASDCNAQSREAKQVQKVIQNALEDTADCHTSILIETSWCAADVQVFLGKTAYKRMGLCYDLGNAAGEGYDVLNELQILRCYIRHIHVKDKNRKGKSVMLGEGNTPLRESIPFLNQQGYTGMYILESYYGIPARNDTRLNVKKVKEWMG